jgi:single-strand DNA-binding protein
MQSAERQRKRNLTMGSLNKVCLIGYLGKDPETKRMPDGTALASLSVATTESWTSKQTGEKTEKTEWHRVTIWNESLVKVADQYLKKGSQVYIEGQIETRKWKDKDGSDRWSTEIVMRPYNSKLVMLGRPGEGGGASRGAEGLGGGPRQDGEGAAAAGGGGGARQPGNQDDMDDSIPF